MLKPNDKLINITSDLKSNASVMTIFSFVLVLCLNAGVIFVEEVKPFPRELKDWLNVQPNKDITPVNPLGGYFWPYKQVDRYPYAVMADEPELYECYHCDACETLPNFLKQSTRMACTECVLIRDGSKGTSRICNVEKRSLCRKEPKAQCCHGDLCNGTRRMYQGALFYAVWSTLLCVYLW